MSSSVFYESNIASKNKSESNLVVVYSKNGVNFDEAALQNIIEEKTISTISVVRLTSPTPSMREEEESDRLAELEQLDCGSDRDESDSEEADCHSDNGDNKSEKEHVTGDDQSQDENDNDLTDDGGTNGILKVRKKPGRKPKIVKKQKKRKAKPKERPPIMGLCIEQFYTEPIADKIVKEALKISGRPHYKRTAETDEIWRIVQNDHNYTPFTSPEQRKALQAAEVEQRAIQARKLIPHLPENIRLVTTKKRIIPSIHVPNTSAIATPIAQQQQQNLKDKQSVVLNHRLYKDLRLRSKARCADEFSKDGIDINKSANKNNTGKDEDVKKDSLEIQSILNESELSNDSRITDNDRESDIDFNVNNRIMVKRKRFGRLKRNINPTKNQITQNQIMQKTQHIKRHKLQQDQHPRVVINPSTSTPIIVRLKRPVVAINPNVVCKSTMKANSQPAATSTPVTTTPSLVRRTQIVQVCGISPSPNNSSTRLTDLTVTNKSQLLSSPQDVKQIVINKNINSPKGVFTNLNTLLNESNKPQKTTLLDTPKSSNVPKISSSSPSISVTTSSAIATRHKISKGFVPLGIETASISKLPAQISIQTHQSSSELAAENERQLDLIDSIVQFELQKATLIEQQPAASDETIPKLVKMLESTAEVLDQQQNLSMPSSTEVTNQLPSFPTVNVSNNAVTNVEDIDITNAPLLDNAEDDIPADFLEHVVGLIEDDEKFKEEVEKQVFGVPFTSEVSNNVAAPFTNEASSSIAPQSTNDNTLVTLFDQPQKPIEITTPSVLLEENIIVEENIPISLPPNAQSTPTIVTGNTSVLNTSEVVQVKRSNGRIITLPPIEAPTTRAKRRAQNSTSTFGIDLNSSHHSESSLDGSNYSNTSYATTDTTTTNQSVKKLLDKNPNIKRKSIRDGPVTTQVNASKPGRKCNIFMKQQETKSNINKIQDDTDASESQDDDDDPKKLWCVCRQPHNNRFMICCDICEDWFHGTCVNITKAMGREMELKGVDWKCPKCIKKQEEKNQPKITELFRLKTYSTSKPEQSNQPELPAGSSTIIKHTPKQLSETKQLEVQNANIKVEESTETNIMKQKVPIPKNNKSFAVQLKPVNVPQNILHQQQLRFSKSLTQTKSVTVVCVFCKKTARPNTIYCSDECIRKYAQASIQMLQAEKNSGKVSNMSSVGATNAQDGKKVKKKDLFEDMLMLADTVTKIERVNVFERKSGRILTGHNAPTIQNLKKWLQDNPTYEVVQTGSVQALEIEKRNIKRGAQVSSALMTKTETTSTPKNISLVESTKTITHHQQNVEEMATLKQSEKPIVSIKQTSLRNDKGIDMPDIKVKEQVKRRFLNSSDKLPVLVPAATDRIEPIRLNVRRTLNELLLIRMKEEQNREFFADNNIKANDEHTQTSGSLPQLSIAEIEQFAKNVELEMFNYFGKDLSHKYKAKYRSLVFNIKDRKNQTLFAKIRAREITAEQLVRMTPDELASQELAKWRENETKHQLEVIKKAELDLLNYSKSYVLKTHKGEEIIEEKSTDYTNLGHSTPEEDIVTTLNKTSKAIDSPEKVNASSPYKDSLRSESDIGKEREKSKEKGKGNPKDDKMNKYQNQEKNKQKEKYKDENKQKEKTRKDSDKEKENGKEKVKQKEKERERFKIKHKNHKEKNRQRSKEKTRSKKRSRSRSRSRTRSCSNEKNRKYVKSHGQDRDKETHEHYIHADIITKQTKYMELEPNKQNTPEREAKDKKSFISSKVVIKDKKIETVASISSSITHTNPNVKPTIIASSCNLVDEILKSVKSVEEAANLVNPKEPEPILITTPPQQSPPIDEHASYVKTLPTVAIWKGVLNMIDVSTFQITVHPFTGNSINLGKLLSKKMEVVGRIHQNIVWDYIEKIKKSPTKEIVVISCHPTASSEIDGYQKLFEYLDTRQRMGVIGSDNDNIRDFYIYPLTSFNKLPAILQTNERTDFFEVNTQRPNIMIGIIVRCIIKRQSTALPIQLDANFLTREKVLASDKSYLKRVNSFTQSSISKHRRISTSKDDGIDIDAIIKAPIAAKQKQLNITDTIIKKDDGDEPYSPGGSSDDEVLTLAPQSSFNEKDELKRKVEEINKQIAAQRKEIAGLLNVEPLSLESMSCTTSTSMLANIDIPPNLSTILANINKKTQIVSQQLQPSAEEYNPEDVQLSNSPSSYTSGKYVKSTTGSRLAQLTEAELLSMVPDDIAVMSKTVHTIDEPPPPGV